MKKNNNNYMSEDIGQFVEILKKSKENSGKPFVVSLAERIYRQQG